MERGAQDLVIPESVAVGKTQTIVRVCNRSGVAVDLYAITTDVTVAI
ncbi:MAG: hypothetical protein HQ543_01005 [Bacteroidetes bacterium]|nr:hypothetical protein [Bacteroidota bacterium]